MAGTLIGLLVLVGAVCWWIDRRRTSRADSFELSMTELERRPR